MSLTAEQLSLVAEIKRLKKKKNAVILVHNYQKPEIYAVADFIGDSLMLCVEAAKTKARMIVFCGVSFMAESAAILNPDKKVVMPFLDAGCAMADMVDIEGLRKLQKKYPKAATVCYVNSTAEVKAISDVCCTSSNAVKVVNALKNKQIIFVPDKNLAAYVAKLAPEKEIIAWEGFCPIHHSLSKKSVDEIRSTYPKAKIIAHPECRPDVLDEADYVTSTSGMIEVAKKDKAKDFFVITECGMTERLHQALPEKRFHGLCNVCYDMKKNNLESVRRALENEEPRVVVDKKIIREAKKAFDKMFALTK